MKSISRKAFIKGAAATLGIAATSVLGGCAAEETECPTVEVPSTPERVWDLESDVLIIGAGGAGMSAGIEARRAGASALILEKSNTFGGSSIRSGGIIQASGTHVQRELTTYQDDTPAKHAEYYLQEGEGLLNRDLVYDMTEDSANCISFLEDMGLVFTNMTGSAHTPMADESLYADRIHGTDVGAVGIYTAVHDTAEKEGVEFVYDTEAIHLIKENGRVVGVEAIQNGKSVFAKGRNGVIIATSSIDHNEEMAKYLCPNQYYDLQNYGSATCPTNTGDGIKMGMEIGADIFSAGGVIDLMGRTYAGVNRQTPLMPCVFVNKYGRRFVCEDSTYAYTSRQVWREITATGHDVYTITSPNWMFNKETLDGLVAANQAYCADSLTELAEKIGVNGANLEKTIKEWNADVATGKDNQFERATGLEPISGPYYAYIEGFANLGSICGMKINLNCEVIDVKGNVIPGLFAAGMASAGWVGPFYPGSGTALLGGLHFGRKAGRIVADYNKYAVSINSSNQESSEVTYECGPNQYIGKAVGMHSEVVVRVSVDNGAIALVEVLSHNETEGIGTNAINALPSQFIGIKTVDEVDGIDSVSGASLTSGALKKAVKEALAQANL